MVAQKNIGGISGQRAFTETLTGFQHGHRHALPAGRGGHLQADPTAADHQQTARAGQPLAQTAGVFPGAQIMHPVTGQVRQPAGLAASSQEQGAVVDQGAVLAAQPAPRPIQGHHPRAEPHLHIQIAPLVRARKRRRVALALQRRLGQRRSLIRLRPLGTDQYQPSLVAAGAQRPRHGQTGLAGADDHHGLGAGAHRHT